MRPSVLLLALGLTVAPAAFAQNWSNTDPQCDDQIFRGTVESVNNAQRAAEEDAQAANDYYKRIKEAPRNSSGKLLSCVDVAWPNLPFSGVLPNIQEYITSVGDAAVEQACNQARDRVRNVDSVFTTSNLSVPSLQGITGSSYSGNTQQRAATPQSGQPAAATPATTPAGTRNNGSFGGITDLIRPGGSRPNPNTNPPNSGNPPR